MLLEFQLKDEPGSVTAILELISAHNFNISYISSQENGTEYQLFKMGLIADNDDKLNVFIDEAKKLCNVCVIDYNHADEIYDNSFFYSTFVSEISSAMNISAAAKNELIVNTNLAMQILNETGVSPYRTFDSISRLVELLALSRAENYIPRITTYQVTDDTVITLIEPPCGSNTAIIQSGGEYLFIDTGYACYRDEMLSLFCGAVFWAASAVCCVVTETDVSVLTAVVRRAAVLTVAFVLVPDSVLLPDVPDTAVSIGTTGTESS